MKYLTIIFTTILFLSFPSITFAQSLITLSSDGEVYKNVLGESSDNAEASSKIVGAIVNKVANIVISEVDSKVQIALGGETGTDTQTYDVKSESILEIQKDIPSKNITIKKLDNGFGIYENQTIAKTSYTISVDPKTKDILLKTGSGDRVLAVLPNAAVSTLTNSNIVTKTQEMHVSETNNGELVYTVSGFRNINLFHTLRIDVPVSATVSATSGKVEEIHEPFVAKVIRILSQ